MVLRDVLPGAQGAGLMFWKRQPTRWQARPWALIGAGSSAALFLGWAGWSVRSVRNVEEPRFVLLGKQGGLELRRYAPHLVAATEVEGDFDTSLHEGFYRLAHYSFGGNVKRQSVAMTAPVSQQRLRSARGEVAEPSSQGARIAMTAPVSQQRNGGRWRVTFVMPVEYSLGTLPRPVDARVKLEEVPARRVAVLRFSGFVPARKAEVKKEKLLRRVREQGLRPVGEPVLAQYTPPWTLPFLRRNEVFVELAD